jgi:ABC-2 type transport system permease protein
MWLFLFGSGMGARYSVDGVSYRDFIYPGILAMTVIFGSVFFGVYIVWDRKIDVFKAVLVAPLSRFSIFAGKVLGGCTDVLLQVSVLFVLSFLFPSASPYGIPLAFLFLFVSAVALVSLGLAIGSLLRSLEGFQLISALIVFPLFFSSGALFPVDRNLPFWLKYLIAINPLSYTVDGVRGALLRIHSHPLWLDFFYVSLFAILMLLLGSFLFSRMKL